MVLTDNFDARVERIFGEYVVKAIEAWEDEMDNSEDAFLAFGDSLLQSLHRIKKRLGANLMRT